MVNMHAWFSTLFVMLMTQCRPCCGNGAVPVHLSSTADILEVTFNGEVGPTTSNVFSSSITGALRFGASNLAARTSSEMNGLIFSKASSQRILPSPIPVRSSASAAISSSTTIDSGEHMSSNLGQQPCSSSWASYPDFAPPSFVFTSNLRHISPSWASLDASQDYSAVEDGYVGDDDIDSASQDPSYFSSSEGDGKSDGGGGGWVKPSDDGSSDEDKEEGGNSEGSLPGVGDESDESGGSGGSGSDGGEGSGEGEGEGEGEGGSSGGADQEGVGGGDKTRGTAEMVGMAFGGGILLIGGVMAHKHPQAVTRASHSVARGARRTLQRIRGVGGGGGGGVGQPAPANAPPDMDAEGTARLRLQVRRYLRESGILPA